MRVSHTDKIPCARCGEERTSVGLKVGICLRYREEERKAACAQCRRCNSLGRNVLADELTKFLIDDLAKPKEAVEGFYVFYEFPENFFFRFAVGDEITLPGNLAAMECKGQVTPPYDKSNIGVAEKARRRPVDDQPDL